MKHRCYMFRSPPGIAPPDNILTDIAYLAAALTVPFLCIAAGLAGAGVAICRKLVRRAAFLMLRVVGTDPAPSAAPVQPGRGKQNPRRTR